MAKIKALQTLHGSYGLAAAGDVIELGERAAKQLIENGLAEAVGDDAEASKSETEAAAKIEADAKAGKSSIRDNTEKKDIPETKEKKKIDKP